MLIISAVKANCYKILFGAKAELVRNGLFIEPYGLSGLKEDLVIRFCILNGIYLINPHKILK